VRGLAIEIDLPDTQTIRDLVAAPIERGDVSQMSFGFSVRPGGQDWAKDDEGRVVRTLKKVRLFDVSPVTFPAYPQTDIAVRELRSWQAGLQARQQQARRHPSNLQGPPAAGRCLSRRRAQRHQPPRPQGGDRAGVTGFQGENHERSSQGPAREAGQDLDRHEGHHREGRGREARPQRRGARQARRAVRPVRGGPQADRGRGAQPRSPARRRRRAARPRSDKDADKGDENAQAEKRKMEAFRGFLRTGKIDAEERARAERRHRHRGRLPGRADHLRAGPAEERRQHGLHQGRADQLSSSAPPRASA
jgi:hypothetical protein